MNNLLISVVVPTYNPDPFIINKCLEGLKNQTLSKSLFELIIIDNRSTNRFDEYINLNWHANAKIIKEPKQGLTNARITGFINAKADIIIMVDDDNILDENYLKNSYDFLQAHPQTGALGGISKGVFLDYEPLQWQEQFFSMVAIRNLGEKTLFSSKDLTKYPACAPIGAGMVLRKSLLAQYIDDFNLGFNKTSDRSGKNLGSGGDNEINIYILKTDNSIAYSPTLKLKHIIPKSRLEKKYLSKLNYESSISWIKLLNQHGMDIWPPISSKTVKVRQLKSYFKQKAWRSEENYIKWKGNCGIFKGLSQI